MELSQHMIVHHMAKITQQTSKVMIAYIIQSMMMQCKNNTMRKHKLQQALSYRRDGVHLLGHLQSWL